MDHHRIDRVAVRWLGSQRIAPPGPIEAVKYYVPDVKLVMLRLVASCAA